MSAELQCFLFADGLCDSANDVERILDCLEVRQGRCKLVMRQDAGTEAPHLEPLRTHPKVDVLKVPASCFGTACQWLYLESVVGEGPTVVVTRAGQRLNFLEDDDTRLAEFHRLGFEILLSASRDVPASDELEREGVIGGLDGQVVEVCLATTPSFYKYSGSIYLQNAVFSFEPVREMIRRGRSYGNRYDLPFLANDAILSGLRVGSVDASFTPITTRPVTLGMNPPKFSFAGSA